MQQNSVSSKSFLFSSWTSKLSSKSPRLSSSNLIHDGSSFSSTSSPPLAEVRPRSGSTAETPTTRKRRGTLIVDHLTTFWETKNEAKKLEKEREKEVERERIEKEKRDREREKEKRDKEREKEKRDKEERDRIAAAEKHRKEHSTSPRPSLFSKQHKREKDISKRDIHISSSPHPLALDSSHPDDEPTTATLKREVHDEDKDVVLANSGVVRKGTYADVQKLALEQLAHRDRDGRVKHKAKSEGSLIVAIFSKKLIERGGRLQKSSSLIELKPMALMNAASAPSKSGSSLQLGKAKSGYFGITLDEAMYLQKEKYPDLHIPVIMSKLTDAILLFNGCKAEGIFRVAGSTQQVVKLQQQLNDMNFDEMSRDPHVLVCVLKQWLRELKEPLIPNSS